MAPAVSISQLAPAAGAVTVTTGAAMLKGALVPTPPGPPFQVTRTRASAAGGPVTIQGRNPKDPLLGAAAASSSYVDPPSRLTSTRSVSVWGTFVYHMIVAPVPII